MHWYAPIKNSCSNNSFHLESINFKVKQTLLLHRSYLYLYCRAVVMHFSLRERGAQLQGEVYNEPGFAISFKWRFFLSLPRIWRPFFNHYLELVNLQHLYWECLHSRTCQSVGGNCFLSLKNLGKIRTFRAATRKYLGKTRIFWAAIEKFGQKQIF